MLHYVISAGGSVCSAVCRLSKHPRTPPIVIGFAMGVVGWSAAHPFVTAFGFSRQTTAALILAAVAAFVLGLSIARRPGFRERGLVGLIATAWFVLLPTFMTFAVQLVGVIPMDWLTVEWICIPALTAAAFCVFGAPGVCAGIIADRHHRRCETTALLVGISSGIAADAVFFAPIVGLRMPLLAVAIISAVAWFARLVRGVASPGDSPVTFQSSMRMIELLATACFAGLVGVGCALSSRVLAQLMLESAYLIACGTALFLLGISLGSGIADRLRRRTDDDLASRRYGGVLVASSILLPLAVFPWLIDRQLDANAFISSVLWLTVVRVGTVAGVLLPLGIGCGLGVSPLRRPGVVAGSIACGFVAAGWLLPVFGVALLAVAAGCGSIASAIGSTGFRLPRTRTGWASAATCTAIIALMATGSGRFNPAQSAHLLFNTSTFLARQSGMPAKLLPVIDDTRLIEMHETPSGIVTVWRKRGEAAIARLDGMPIAATSQNPAYCPLPSGDAMRIALPLLLHHDADSVLVLGDPLGVATATAARFPVRSIVCCDTTVGETGVASSIVDDRIATIAIEPRLALASTGQRFDVVVSDPGIPSAPAAASYFTREFYAVASAALTDDGIFCQRIRYADYGPGPLRVVAATMQSVFGEVMTIEIASGEYAVLGVRPGQSLVRDGLLERLKRPHARRLLASFGWDWCVPLNLTSVENEGMSSLAGEARTGNSDANGHLAYTLPQETMRWGAKWQELQQATAGKTSRLFVRAVPEEEQEDVLTRIAEVTGQHRLMTAFPDQPWAYRKELRTQLAEKPRGVIRPVAGEVLRERHPVDLRRIDYFKALGEAIHESSEQNLAKLERFAEPYDPMLTYFLHHEIAPLYSAWGEAGAAGEFAHRIYTAYYADPRDRSVRDVASTIELLAAHPTLIADDAGRFDHLNGLIEVLLDRWEARGMTEPRSPAVIMIDADKSLDATEAAIEAMTPLTAAAGLSDEEWKLRQAAIERTFTRPLRKYRTSLLPHLRAAQKKTAAAESSAVDLE